MHNFINKKLIIKKNRNFYKQKKIKLNFCHLGLIISKVILLFHFHFVSLKNCCKIIFNNKLKKKKYKLFWFFLFFNYPCRKKSKNARMGKGNGSFFSWAIKLSSFFIFAEFFYLKRIRLFYFLKKIKKKICKNFVLVH